MLDDSTVYFVGIDHDLVAVEKASGRVRWRGRTSDPGNATNGKSAVVAGEIVAFGDWDIHGFDRQSGVRRWTFRPLEGQGPGLYYLATDGETVFAGSPSGRVYGVDAVSGVQRWMTVLATDGNTGVFNPIVSGDVVFVCVKHFTTPTTGSLVALEKLTGTVKWSAEIAPEGMFGQGGCNRRPAAAGSVVAASSQDGHVYAFDQSSGVRRWAAPQLTALPPGTIGNPSLDDRPVLGAAGFIIVGSTTGFVVALDTGTGQERWRATADRGSVAAPLVADETQLYVAHDGFQIGVFHLATGSLRYRAADGPNGGEFYPSPAVDAERLYAGGIHGLYALRK